MFPIPQAGNAMSSKNQQEYASFIDGSLSWVVGEFVKEQYLSLEVDFLDSEVQRFN